MWFIPTTTTNPEREREREKTQKNICKVTCTCNLLSFPSPPHVALSLSHMNNINNDKLLYYYYIIIILTILFIYSQPTLADFTVIPWISSPVICPRGREEKDRDNERNNHLLHFVVIKG